MGEKKDVAVTYKWQAALVQVPSVFQLVLKLVGVKALGAILSSRKGVFGLIAIVVSYVVLIGMLPANATPEMVAQATSTFVWLVGAIAGLYMGGTALEDVAAKKAAPIEVNLVDPNIMSGDKK